MACVLAALSLACAFSAHGQIIDEGGFPVKEGGVEPFSLSCSHRLYARAGESVAISCSAAAVPEEGVRYRWEPVSGDALRFLSDAQALAPVFTAPVSGEGTEYVYRLTAAGAGVYATSSVTVTVQGASRQSIAPPGLQEECDPLRIPDEPGEGCAEEKGPFPFGFGYEQEEEFLFPEAPGLPEQSGGFDSQAPPRLECPAAVFMEELEAGVIECHAWDASGEEYLEYSWEPVGSTTRNYLDNPRLLPEDSPTPSVIAPETPSYETLESFLSGDRAFRYRYRLTATSRATGLSSHEEVEIYVSSSRPGVYCPLEVVVEEGETAQLDCEGVDPLSLRMDYDEEAASVLWEWEGLWGTSTAPLAETHLPSPLFTAPPGSAGEEYHYIASMTSSASGAPRTARRKVTVTVVAGQKTQAAAGAPVVTCTDSEVYEAADDFALDCSVTNEPAGATYAWTARGSTSGTSLLSSTTTLKPTFDVPASVTASSSQNSSETYQYTVTLSASGIDDVTEDITVTVRDKDILCWHNNDFIDYDGGGGYKANPTEGGSNVQLEVCAAGVTGPDGPYTWEWTGSAESTALLTNTNMRVTYFRTPADVTGHTTYKYIVNISAAGANTSKVRYTVKVLDTDAADPSLTCTDSEVYEAAADITLDCSVTNEPTGATYAWTGTDVANRLTGTSSLTPTFDVPDEVGGSNKEYDYTVTLSASGTDNVTEDVTVTVLEKPDITVTCEDSPYEVDEGDDDIELVCEADGSPDGSAYTWSWSPTTDLTSHDTATPTFSVPADVDKETTYTYTVTATAANADDGTATVRVTVNDTSTPAPVVTCNDSEVYEAAADITLDCSVTNEPTGVTYAWAARGSTSGTSLLSSTTILQPTFDVPDEVGGSNKEYDYTVTLSATGIDNVTENVTVTVLEKPDITSCLSIGSHEFKEGGAAAKLTGCLDPPQGAPGNNPVYRYRWEIGGATPSSALSLLSARDVASPFFTPPDDVQQDVVYVYRQIISADNADDYTTPFFVTVTDTDETDFNLQCGEARIKRRQGSPDLKLPCEAPGAPEDATWKWTARAPTANTDRLSATDIPNPVFDVPDRSTRLPRAGLSFYYTVVVSAGSQQESVDLTVTVFLYTNYEFECSPLYPEFFEGDDEATITNCSVNSPYGTEDLASYEWKWTARAPTQDTALLSATNIPNPVFKVPENVDGHAEYKYALEITAWWGTRLSFNITATVFDRDAFDGQLSVVCTDPAVYEGSENFTLDCKPSGAPDGAEYSYVWKARPPTPHTARLIDGTDGPNPTFAVPRSVDQDREYTYTVTVSAGNTIPASTNVKVTVLDKKPLAVSCADPSPSVYEGSADVAFDCSASGGACGFYLRIHLDGPGRYAGYGAARFGYRRSHSDICYAVRCGGDDDLRIHAYRYGGECRIRIG